MIVCICHNVSDGKIHQAVDGGVTSMVQLRDHLGVGTCCGKCHSHAKQVLRECLSNNNTNNTQQSHCHMLVFQRNVMAA